MYNLKHFFLPRPCVYVFRVIPTNGIDFPELIKHFWTNMKVVHILSHGTWMPIYRRQND